MFGKLAGRSYGGSSLVQLALLTDSARSVDPLFSDFPFFENPDS